MTTGLKLEPIRIGPKGRPKITLGWQVLGWTLKNLRQPDGPNAEGPWVYTQEQVDFILWWYATDKRGRFIYRGGMLRRMKGWGKDPIGATICAIEFVGPCRFSGKFYRDDAGDIQPRAIPHPAAWIQTAAVTKDQTRNTMTLFPGLFSPATMDEHRIDLGKEIVYAHRGRARIESVTSSPRALEGGRASFVLKNETHHWVRNNDGLAMSQVIARNVAKSRDGSARVLAISNAHSADEESDALHDYERRDEADFLYDSLESPLIDLEDEEQVAAGVRAARGDSDWLDVERLVAEIMDPTMEDSLARRYYLNQIARAADKAFDAARWNQLTDPGHRVPAGALVTGGFDGSISRDHTVLIGTEVATGYQWVVGYWEPVRRVDGSYSINEAEVNASVEAFFERYQVWRLNGDPFGWKEWMNVWAGRYNKPGKEIVVSWNTTLYKKMAFALLNYRDAINGGDISHDGDIRFATAIGNAHKHMQHFTDDFGDPMWTIDKERMDSPFKIDAAMAGCLSWEARSAAIAAGAVKEEPAWHGILI